MKVCARRTNSLAAASFIALNWTACVNLNFALRVCCARWWPNAILDLRCHCHKGLLNVGRVFSGCLKEWNSELIGVFLKIKIISNQIKFFSSLVLRMTKTTSQIEGHKQ